MGPVKVELGAYSEAKDTWRARECTGKRNKKMEKIHEEIPAKSILTQSPKSESIHDRAEIHAVFRWTSKEATGGYDYNHARVTAITDSGSDKNTITVKFEKPLLVNGKTLISWDFHLKT